MPRVDEIGLPEDGKTGEAASQCQPQDVPKRQEPVLRFALGPATGIGRIHSVLPSAIGRIILSLWAARA